MSHLITLFFDKPFSGIDNFSRRLAESSCGEMDVKIWSKVNWFKVIAARECVVVNFPSISKAQVFLCLMLMVVRVFGCKLKLIVHEISSQSMFGRLLLIFLSGLADKVYVVSPVLNEEGVTQKIRNAQIIIQGSNIKRESVKYSEAGESNVILIAGSRANFEEQYLFSVFNSIVELNKESDREFEVIWLGLKSIDFEQYLGNKYARLLKITFHNNISPASFSNYLFLSKCGVFPLVDGFTARRSSVIAALTHGLPCLIASPKSQMEKEWISSRDYGITFSSKFDKSDVVAFLNSISKYSRSDLVGYYSRVFDYNSAAKSILEG